MDISQPNQEEPIPSTHKETSPIIEKNETAILVEDSPTAVVKETRKFID